MFCKASRNSLPRSELGFCYAIKEQYHFLWFGFFPGSFFFFFFFFFFLILLSFELEWISFVSDRYSLFFFQVGYPVFLTSVWRMKQSKFLYNYYLGFHSAVYHQFHFLEFVFLGFFFFFGWFLKEFEGIFIFIECVSRVFLFFDTS